MRTGIRRKVDDLGRIVIPAGIRRSLGIRQGDALEIHVEGDHVILTRPTDECVFCTGRERLTSFHGRPVCDACVEGVGALGRPAARPRPDGERVGRHPWGSPTTDEGFEDPATAAWSSSAGHSGRWEGDDRDPPASTTAR